MFRFEKMLLKKCIGVVLILFWGITAWSQTQQADKAFEQERYRDAIVLYQQKVSELENNSKKELKIIGKCHQQTGMCYLRLLKADSALMFYHKALDVFRKIPDAERIAGVRSDIFYAHDSVRHLNLNWKIPDLKQEQVGEVYFKIEDIRYFGKDSVKVTLHAGSYDGIMPGTMAKCIGTKKKTKDRSGWILASGMVRSVEPNRSILYARLLNPDDTLRNVRIGDAASVFCKYNQNKKAGLLQDLAKFNIRFCDNYKTPLFDWRSTLDPADLHFEPDIYNKLKSDILEIYDLIKDDKDYDAYECTDGLFKGLKLKEALKISGVDEIRAFLHFVKAYPVKYAGVSFVFADTYATWIINNCPANSESMMAYYLSLSEPKLKSAYLQNNRKDVYHENYFATWVSSVLKQIRQNQLTDMDSKLEMLRNAAETYGDTSFLAWYAYCHGKYASRNKDTALAGTFYRTALNAFIRISDNEGIYLANEALQKKQPSAIPEVVLQNGHAGYFEICFSPDGKYFITVSDDKNMKLWDARLGKQILTVEAHGDEITSVDYSRDGRYVITCSEDKTVKLWHSDALKLIRTFQTGIVNRKVILSPNGDFFIVCGTDSVIQMWDIKKQQLIRKFSKHRKRVYNLEWAADYNSFFSCSSDSFVYQWDYQTGEILKWFKEKSRVIQVKTSPDGKWMATTLSNGKIDVWDLDHIKSIYFFNNVVGYNNDSSSLYICEPVFSKNSRYFIYGYQKSKIVIMELATGNGISYNTSHFMEILQIQTSDDGSYLATVGRDFKINLFDFQDYVFDERFELRRIEIMGFNGGGSVIQLAGKKLFIYGNSFIVYNLETGKSEILKSYLPFGIDTRAVFNSTYDEVVGLSGNFRFVFKFNIRLRTVDTLYRSDCKIHNIDYDFNTHALYLYDKRDRLTYVQEGKIQKSIKANLPDSAYCGMGFHGSLKKLAIQGYHGLRIYDHQLNFSRELTQFKDSGYALFNRSGGNYLARTDVKGGVQIIDMERETLAGSLNAEGNKHHLVYTLNMCANDTQLLISRENSILQLWNWRTGSRVQSFDVHNRAYILSTTVSDDGNYFASSALDSKIALFNLKSRKTLCYLYPMLERGVLTLTDSGYYMAPKNCYGGFVFKLNRQIYTPEQFDLQFHRPDKIVKIIGAAGPEIIETYKAAYLKRVIRTGQKETGIQYFTHLPSIELQDKEFLPITVNRDQISLSVQATDLQYQITAFRVWVNNIPVYGASGVSVKPASEASMELNIPLQTGKNMIKIAAVNEKGMESLKEFYQVESNYTDSTKVPKTHLFILSVSRYRDSSYNLKYAAKDGRDLIQLFRNRYRNLLVDSLINEKATRHNILSLKSKLMQTGVNDRVIVFISGHGLLDKSFNFYFATADMDFNHPERNGVSYDQINQLLDGIPARKKLLLMDACHSGEVDKEGKILVSSPQNDTLKGNADFAKKGGKLVNTNRITLQNSFDLMQDLFSELSNSNGAVVISAARGTGYALESSKWNNGAFSYALLNGLGGRKADSNTDGSITISELSAYIIQEVESLTQGSQKPTSRAENIEYDWEIW